MFLAPSRSDPGESLLITTLLGIPLREPDGKTPTVAVGCSDEKFSKYVAEMKLIADRVTSGLEPVPEA